MGTHDVDLVRMGLDHQAAKAGEGAASERIAGEIGSAMRALFAHDAPAAGEGLGKISASERALLPGREPSPPDEEKLSQRELDAAIATMLRVEPSAPDEYLCVWTEDHGGPPAGERENAYLALRMNMAAALERPCIANFVAVGEACQRLARLSMAERAAEFLRVPGAA